MTDGQWTTTLRSKVQTSWNLHHLLPDLDFFLLLSSVSGVIGNPGQANYAAGCSFQDSLARYRAHTGQKAVSIDLGPMDTIGVVAETESLQQHFERSRSLKLVKEQELISLLDMYCDPTRNFSTAESQVAMGLSTPGEMLARQLEPAEFMQRPLFTFFKEVGDNSVGSCLTNRTRAGELFRKAQSADEQSAVVVEALAEKLARALSMKVQDLDVDQPLHAHGVDSLVAVEIRNWISKEFAADIPVFEINGRRTVASVGELVAKTIQINPGKVAKQESASSL